ncbi:MAG: chromophore lyase CpcT/CpeT, partial [Salibacteraceae bacterium]
MEKSSFDLRGRILIDAFKVIFRASILFYCLFSTSVLAQESAELEMLTEYMSGSFSSSEQAKGDPTFEHFNLHIARIWDKDDGVWLYVEHSKKETPDNPHIQQIYRLEKLGNIKFAIHIYDIPEKKNYTGAWKKPKRFKSLHSSDLKIMDGCSLGVIYTNGTFIGNIQAICENHQAGADMKSSEMEVHKDKLLIWDKGWTKGGTQVWGSENGSYIF